MSLTSVPGTVFDSNGKTVAEATVSATNTETSKVVSTATSESNGSFLIIVSTGATYQFTASKSGETGLKRKARHRQRPGQLIPRSWIHRSPGFLLI
jgi:Carboxypeptidase regulatory-like domain